VGSSHTVHQMSGWQGSGARGQRQGLGHLKPVERRTYGKAGMIKREPAGDFSWLTDNLLHTAVALSQTASVQVPAMALLG